MSQQPSSSDHHHRSAIGSGLSLNGESPILNDIVTSTDLFNSNNRRSSQSQSSTISNSNFSCENSVPSTTSQQQQLSSNSFNNEIERTKENRASPTTIDITAIQHNNTSQTQLNTTDKGTTSSSWGFSSSGGGGGEENTLPKSSLDKVIIGSLPQQDSAPSSSISVSNTTGSGGNSANSGSVIITNTKTLANNNTNSSAVLIQISDKAHPPPSIRSLPEQQQPIAQLAQESTSPHSNTPAASLHNSSADSKRLRFKSLLADSVSASSATTTTTTTSTCDIGSGELNSSSPATTTVKSFSRNADRASRQQVAATSGNQISERDNKNDNDGLADKINQEEISLGTLHEEPNEGNDYISDYEDDNNESLRSHARIGQFESYIAPNGSKAFSSPFRKSTYHLFGNHALLRIQRLLSVFSSKFVVDKYRETPYVPQEGKDLLTGDQKYSPSSAGQRTKKPFGGAGRTFRGDYKYSRTGISMAIFKKLIDLLFQKSTLALIGAFLIHITLGTVYTLSNINSYLTSYMRLHGSPNLTYGGSMWISSFYAIGQGFSMVLGGYIEKRFSARLACFLGCFIHSGSIMSTSWSVNHGSLAVLMSYGFLPGFGCGLAYMTPMSNGFGWFPNRRGLVAGVILAGFGIGTFVFNIAQTAYVNPNNLSPPADSGGYFIQESILTHVPGLFLFIGTIYAAMQFVGCCLLFKPPSYLDQGKSPDERPILETEVSVGRAVRTREFVVLFLVYGIITQGVLFVNSMIKEYGQLFIGDDMYLAWTGSMASIANALGRLCWGLAIDRYSFTQCFTCITTIFGFLMFLMPFEFVLSSKQLYLICTLGIFGSFSGWMSTFPVHLSRTFGRLNSGMLYGLIFISQSFGGIASAFGAHYLIDHYSRFVPFFCVVFLEILGLAIYHLFYPKHRYL